MLWPGGEELRGVVLDATGGPIAHAAVRAFFPLSAVSGGSQAEPRAIPTNEALTAAVVTEDDGSFGLWVPKGRLGVRAEAGGYAPSHVTRMAPDSNVQIMLSPAGTIRGRVVSARDGKPISGATVRASTGTPSPFDVATSLSDETGSFSIGGLRAGVYRVHAAGTYWRGSLARSVVLGISEVVGDVVVPVDQATTVSATVITRPSGAPCASGRARIAIGPSFTPLDAAIAAGVARFEGVPVGRYGGRVECHGQLAAAITPFDVGDDEVRDLIWTVDAGEALRVRVVDERHAAIADETLIVELLGGSPAPDAQRICVTDSMGLCQLSGLRAGPHRITSKTSRRSIEARVPEAVELVLVVPAVAELEVNVRTSLGDRVDNLTVYAQGGESSDVVAQPLGEGMYRIAPIAPGTYRVFATDGLNPGTEAALASGGIAVSAGETKRVTLERPSHLGVLRGRVTDGHGRGVADVWVEAWSAQLHDAYASVQRFRRRSEGLRNLTDREGRFAIEGVDERATFQVKVEHGLGGSLVVDGISTAREAEIVLEPTAKLAGSALDEEGDPVASFQLQITNTAAEQRRTQVISDRTGRWLVEAIAAGDVQLDAIDASGRAAAQTVRVAPGQELSGVTLVFSAPATH